MPTPCTGECRAVGGICISCGRTLSEIGQWRVMSDEQQRLVIAELEGRISTGLCARCGEPLYCAVSAGEGIEACWCSQTRPLPFSAQASGCLCRRCHGQDQQAFDGAQKEPKAGL